MLDTMTVCPPGAENAFGPASSCRFDFTLFFEQLILAAIPSLTLILLALSRIHFLRRQDSKTVKNSWGLVKLVGLYSSNHYVHLHGLRYSV